MSRPYVVDVSSYQNDTVTYFDNLKKAGAKSAIVKLTQGTNYVSAKASSQVSNAYKVFGSVSAYHYYMGNPVAEAKFFLSKAKAFGLDKTTWLAIDVEDPSLPMYNTAGINSFLTVLKNAGYSNLMVYGSASWFKAGRIKQGSLLKGSKIWCAAYNNVAPGINGVDVWQYTDNFKGLSVDGSIDFNSILTSKGEKVKAVEKPTYYDKNGLYEVTADIIHAYKTLPLKQADDKHNQRFVRRAKGSRFYGVAVKDGDIYSLKTKEGYYTANKLDVKLIKSL